MGLSRQQRKQLQEALIDAFPTKAPLEQMLSFELDKNLEVIAGEGNLQEIVFKIIQTAEAEAWVEKLIGAAHRANPGNPKLQAIHKLVIEFSSRNNVQKLLLKQVSTEVESRLSSSLHNRIYIVQDTEQNPSQIELPWASEIKVGSKPKVQKTNTKINTIYDQPDIAGRLLILGEPGVGKTTMLLKLAEELVNRVKNNSAHSIPVLFSLSSWKNDSYSIKEWLVKQLKDKYGVRKDIAKGLVDNQEIIPLLDGLDELAAERQEKCVIKINEFLHPSNWTNPVVVCSRIEEYQRYQTLLQLNNSLELHSLTSQQVEQYLRDTENLLLWYSISQDENLKQFAQTPLFLNIIVLSAHEISIQTWQQFHSSDKHLSYLFDAYIRRMLKRSHNHRKHPKHENTQRWLGWLAQILIESQSTEFLIEEMQPNILISRTQQIIHIMIETLIFGLIGGLIGGLILGLTVGLIIVLIIVLSGYFEWLIGDFVERQFGEMNLNKINLVEKITLKINKNAIIFGLIFGLIFGFALGLIHEFGLIAGLITGLILGLAYGLIGRQPEIVENKKIANQGIWKSLFNAIFLGLILALIFGMSGGLIGGVIFGLSGGVIGGVIGWIFFGGSSCIQHFSLRLILYFNGYIPWNYARFLDYCTERLFLQRVGGRYRFIHKMLQDHFAQMEFRRD